MSDLWQYVGINAQFYAYGIRNMANQHAGMESDSVNDISQIAKNLSFLLKSHNITINHLANELSLPMMTIRRLINGETEDPRISTLKIIAKYFNVSVDYLISVNNNLHNVFNASIPFVVPKIEWDDLSGTDFSNVYAIDGVKEWKNISLTNKDALGKNSFFLESRPSMYPRFPKGTTFVIDPDATPTDGDVVLVKILENNEFTLRELIIDPPEWRLDPLIHKSKVLNYSKSEHIIIGVNVISIFCNGKIGF